nr:unnamed protein product [Callosobruchus chinensis]
MEDQVKEIVIGELQGPAGAGELSLTAVAPALLDRYSGVGAKPFPYNGKTSLKTRLNSWSNEEKACMLTSMLRGSAAAVLENPDLRDYGKITSALKLRFGNAHSTELLFGQLHNRTQQAKKDLTTFAYEG